MQNCKKSPRALGFVPDLIDFRDHTFKAAPTTEYQTKNRLIWVPQPKNQLYIGSCVAESVIQLLHFDRIRQKLPTFSPSALFLYYNARKRQGWEQIDSGCLIRDAIKSVAELGCCPESVWPYDTNLFNIEPPATAYEEAFKYKSLSYKRIETIADMKACLAEGFPFVAGITLYNTFPFFEGNGEVPMPNFLEDVSIGGHALTFVGSDDETERFTFLNSWGVEWGNNGRGTIPYKYMEILANDCWQISSVE